MPPVIIPETVVNPGRAESEERVLEALKRSLSEDWFVFQSFDFLSRDPREQKLGDGEIDFILYHPDHGILVLEVKGGSIALKNGVWIQGGQYRIDPVGQAKGNKYRLRDIFKRKLGLDPVPIKFAHALCFPDVSDGDEFSQAVDGLVITGKNLSQIQSFAVKVFAATKVPASKRGGSEEPFSVDKNAVLRILNPEFEYGVRLAERVNGEKNCFVKFTEDQWRILEALAQNRRVKVEGCAGSGKTLLAIKKAQKLAATGKSVLLVCYNIPLSEFLKKNLRDQHNVKVVAFYEYCREVLPITEKEWEQYKGHKDFYPKALPKLLKEYAERTLMFFDAIIVDEGQDFSKEVWECLESMLAVGNESGDFYIFYDPFQNIFRNKLNIPETGFSIVTLKENCRNTQNIFKETEPYIRDSGYTSKEGTPIGAPVQIYQGETAEECRKLLDAAITRLVNYEKISTEDIVIQGGRFRENTSIGDNLSLTCGKIVENQVKCKPGEVRYFTYMKFKGLEAKVVILIDVGCKESRWTEEGLYTAMSRAQHQLVLIEKRSAKEV